MKNRFYVIITGLLGLLPGWVGAQSMHNSNWFTWREGTPLPVPQGLSAGFMGFQNRSTSGDVLLYAGGSNFDKPRWEGGSKHFHAAVYALKKPGDNKSRWERVGEFAHPIADGATVELPEGLLCIGGTDGQAVFNDVVLLRWTGSGVALDSGRFPPLPVGCANPASALLGSALYVAGGKTAEGKALNTVWKLNLQHPNAWEPVPTWPGPARFGANLVRQSNGERDCLYLFSGKSDEGYLTDAYRFDPKEGQWVALQPLPRAALLAPATAFGASHILVFSGSDGHGLEKIPLMKSPDDYLFNPQVLAYHTITNTWQPVGQMPRGLVGSRALAHQKDVWIVGGEIAPGCRTQRIQIAQPAGQVAKSLFGWPDYTVLVLYLVVLAGISYYFSKRNHTADDFLLGGQRIPAWAAGISMLATQVSAMGFMTVPAKSYAVNWAYFAGVFTWFIAVPVVTHYFIPLIRRLKVTSVYAYLEERFDRRVRLLAASLFMLFQLARMGVVLYLPALALSAVTPLDTLTCILLMGLLSTAYTVMGGIEGVIWIEVVQALLLFCGAILCVGLAIGGIDGGFGTFFRVATDHQKLTLGTWDWSLTSSTLMVIVIGNIFIRLGNLTTDQAVVQRYLTTPTTAQAQKTVWTDVGASIPWAIVVYLLGTALYVFYQQHPQKLAGTISTDGILPFFIAQNAPSGISGLIIAGIFSATMGSSQSHIHSLATIFTTDFYRYVGPARIRPLDSRKTFVVARTMTLLLGLLSTALAVTLLYLDIRSLLDFFYEITGLFVGSSTGLFILGIFTRRANATGTLVGALASMVLLYGIKAYTPLSFWLYSAVGFFACVVLGYGFSLLLKGKSRTEGLTIHTPSVELTPIQHL